MSLVNSVSDVTGRQRDFYNAKYREWKRLSSVDEFWAHLGDRIIENMAITRGKSYLFVGSGDGYLSEYISEKTQANITGIDVSDYSVKICNSRKSKNTVYALADAQSLPFEDGSFNGIIAPAVLHHLPDVASALREFRRVAVDGSFIFSIDPRDYFLRWILNPFIERRISRDEVQFKRVEIKKLYSDSGFEIINDDPLYLFIPVFVPLLRRLGRSIPLSVFKTMIKVDTFLGRVNVLRPLSWVTTITARVNKARAG